jgi:hypothetical protein
VVQDETADVYNVVVDHCSLGWSPDENVDVWASDGRFVRDITINNCLIHESLLQSEQGQESYGVIFGQNGSGVISRVFMARNLLTGNKERNPLFKGGVTQTIWANNVTHNAALGAYVLFSDDLDGGPITAAVVGNVFKRGPSGSPSEISWWNPNMDGNGAQVFFDDYLSLDAAGEPLALGLESTAPEGAIVLASPVGYGDFPILSAAALEASVLASVGARPGERGGANEDADDARLIAEYQAGTGAIPADAFLFTLPTVAANSAEFSIPASPQSTGASGYTLIEEALHAAALAVE